MEVNANRDPAHGREYTTVGTSLVLLLLLLTLTIAPITTSTVQTTRSTPQQDTSRGNPVRESDLATYPYWAKSYGGSGDDSMACVRQTEDGGYILAGYTDSFGAVGYDAWVLKLDANGDVTWQKSYGGTGQDYAKSINQTTDGGYIVAGYTNSSGAGGYDAWVFKLNSSGGLTWQYTYGDTLDDYAYCVQQTADGGYVVAGERNLDADGYSRLWILRLNSNGGVTWEEEMLGGPDSWFNRANYVEQTADGGFIVGGATYDAYEDWHRSAWVLKLHPNGNVEWQHIHITEYEVTSIHQTADGGYVLAENTAFWFIIAKLNTTGGILWQKLFVHPGDWGCDANSIQQTADGGYIVAGQSHYIGTYYWDFWVLKLNSLGVITWQKAYGSSNHEDAFCIQQTADGGYVAAGYTTTFETTNYNAWVVKLLPDGGIVFDSDSNASTCSTTVDIENPGLWVVDENAYLLWYPTDLRQSTTFAAQDTQATIEIQAPPSAPAIDLPSTVFYTVGEYGNTITWHPSSQIPSNYSITRDGTPVASGIWSGSSITQDIDGLGLGTYNYMCTVGDIFGRNAGSNVVVNVVSEAAPTIDDPSDITYDVNSTGHGITWHPSSVIPSWYLITRNESTVASGSWTGSSITQDIDGLGLGTYNYMCTVGDIFGRNASSSVLVVVVFPSAPTIDNPSHFTYVSGTTGHSITWHPSSHIPSKYLVTRGPTTVVASGDWSGGDVIVNVDGLPVGESFYWCTVNDTLGRSVKSSYVRVEVVPVLPTIDQPPDFYYVHGTIGHTITWHPSSPIPSAYRIDKDGNSFASGSWNGSAISINVDGLSVGTYSFMCTIWDDLDRTANSTVIVTIGFYPTTTTTTSTGETGQGIPMTFIAGGVAVAVILMVAILAVRKRKT